MDLGFRGHTLVSVKVNYSAILEFSGKYFLTLESPFTLHTSTGVQELSPEPDSADRFAPIEALVGVEITRAECNETGNLEVFFANGTVIRSRPHGDYEPWNVAGPRGFKVVCMPSGGLSVWDPEPENN